jgi:hypothetical protein
MFIPDPAFTHPGSLISDPGSKNSKIESGDKNLLSYLFGSHKFHKIVYYFIFEMLKKKMWANFQRIIELFTPKMLTNLSNIWFWDPGSGKNLFRNPDPGIKKAPVTGSRIRIRYTGYRSLHRLAPLCLFFLYTS